MPKTRTKRRPRIEMLEDRRVPATWGVPWADPQHLTASFVPDGTMARGQSSQLYQSLDAELGVGNWEPTILRALQTWAVNSNINVGLVADGGQPLGIAGPAQGDARFGDIRISAEPLPADVVAITSPYSPAYGTTSGDIILNSNDDFNPADPGSYDLFTVALHEAGHVFGFADSTDPANFMYNLYTGPQSGLASGAVPALQALYGGARMIDSIDGTAVSFNPSKPIMLAGLSSNSPSVTAMGDLAPAFNNDYFAFKAPDSVGVSVQVQTAGISLLAPKVTVRNAAGVVVATASASGPLDGGASVSLPGLVANQTYTIQVQGATGDVFSTGSYDLTVASLASSTSPSRPTAGAKAIPPASLLTVSNSISQDTQDDVYSFKTPASVANGLSVSLQQWGLGLDSPGLKVYDALGNLVATTPPSASVSSGATLHLNFATPNATYYVEADTGTINSSEAGTYQVSISFAAPSTGTPSSNFVLAAPWFGAKIGGTAQANTNFSAAANLVTPAGDAPMSRYEAIEGIASSQPQQFYRFNTLHAPVGQVQYMTVSVQTLNLGSLQPWISVLDSNAKVLGSQILTEQDGIAVVQVALPAASTQFTVEVSSAQVGGAQAMGNFFLDVTFGTAQANLATVAGGSLPATPAGSQPARASVGLAVAQSELFTFVLVGSASNSGTDAILQMTLLDSSGNVVSTLSTPASLAASMTVFLPQGSYTILIGAYSPSNQPIPQLYYTLDGTNITDPIRGTPPTGTGGTTGGGGTSGAGC